MAQLDLDRATVAAVEPQQVEAAQWHGDERLPGDRCPPVSVASLEIAKVLPAPQGERPRRDCLQQGGLAGVVRAGEHGVSGQMEFNVPKALEAADAYRPDHDSTSVDGAERMRSSKSAGAPNR